MIAYIYLYNFTQRYKMHHIYVERNVLKIEEIFLTESYQK